MTKQEREDIRLAVETLRKGGVILYPTDTVWGLGCDATNPEAVKRVYDIKQRRDSKALITLMDSTTNLERYFDDIPPQAIELAELTTTPLTIIYSHASGLPSNLRAEDGSAGVRIPLDRFCLELCRTFRKPIVSTSANISGHPTPACFRDIDPSIAEAADYVCASRRDDTTPHRPSGIIKFMPDGTFKILR